MNFHIKEETKNNIYKICKYIIVILIFLLIIGNIFALVKIFTKKDDSNSSNVSLPKQEFVIKGSGETLTKTETEIVYVPKETVKYYTIDGTTGNTIETERLEKTDIDANIGKPSVNVKVNDREVEIKKDDNEKYVFEKNKLKLTQTSNVDFNIHVDPIEIDKTKHWGIGGGYNSKNGATVIAEFPINKKGNIDGWVTKDSETVAAGIIVKF